MMLFSSLTIGILLSFVVRRIMKKRSYGPVDDLIWGVLGALLGGGLADLLGLSTYGNIITLLMTTVGASTILILTGLIKA